jgi:hypothetical protein
MLDYQTIMSNHLQSLLDLMKAYREQVCSLILLPTCLAVIYKNIIINVLSSIYN